MPNQTVTLSFEDLSDLVKRILIKANVGKDTAKLIADNCVSCEADGTLSHGLFRVAGYLSSLKCGWVSGNANPKIEDCGASFIRVDADNGFAQVSLDKAKPLVLQKVKESGVCVLSIASSHHLSALWPDVEPFAREGLVALSFVAGLAVVVHPGGRKTIYGTNPFAFATPVANSDPLVFDFATSALSNGDTRIAASKGHMLADNSGIDSNGNSTNDPKAILDGGALLPFGGHKGAAIILMVEILAGALTGGAFSTEVDFKDYQGAETPKTGQLFIIIDPQRGNGRVFSKRVKELLDLIRESGENVRLPGDKRYQQRQKALREGITITKSRYDELLSYLQD
ncbi:Ldh family oxidoreductase [Bartonella sp. HY329]|uniref:Ldh family oxidoreductase n=1 Tax=unclassified Bartonella TaxID=2645622 RepID=UPI0021C8BD83|nr:MULTISPECIES: Ldh family oxidoreductase [unclassified Bartonella]UXM95608.1 Ldh family oxidoreductase [Bartonella sp. HY329]UXN09933.1 Ldh family oxidoreductase [Bartonella sp. HY328]